MSTFLGKKVNLSSESGQLYSDEAVNQIRMGKQVLKTRLKKSQPYLGKDTKCSQHSQFSQLFFDYPTNSPIPENGFYYIFNI